MLSFISILFLACIACTVLVLSALVLSSRMSQNEVDIEAFNPEIKQIDKQFDTQFKPHDVH